MSWKLAQASLTLGETFLGQEFPAHKFPGFRIHRRPAQGWGLHSCSHGRASRFRPFWARVQEDGQTDGDVGTGLSHSKAQGPGTTRLTRGKLFFPPKSFGTPTTQEAGPQWGLAGRHRGHAAPASAPADPRGCLRNQSAHGAPVPCASPSSEHASQMAASGKWGLAYKSKTFFSFFAEHVWALADNIILTFLSKCSLHIWARPESRGFLFVFPADS